MSKAYDFLKECGTFYLLTINGDFPAGRPFGAVMEINGYLYVSTNDRNETHKQLRKNRNVQILAKKEGTREWLRINGIAEECKEWEMKETMFEKCPNIRKHFSSAYDERFLIFRITVLDEEFH